MARRNVFSGNEYIQQYDGENDVLVDELRGKVGLLNSLAVDMGEEIKYQNSFLGGMTTDFENSSYFLKNSMNRVKLIASSGHNRYIFYLIIFAFFVFFMIYIIIKFR